VSVQLTRSRIVGTAIDLIEHDGVAALSMRGLAAELGCGVVSLYDRVPSKAALLDCVAAAVVSKIDLTAGRAQGRGWEDRVRARARAFREVGSVYPRCAVLAASRPPAAGAPRAAGECALGALSDAGIDSQDSARITRSILAYLAGSVLRDACLSPSPAGKRGDEDFEFGLDLLLRATGELLQTRGGQQARAS
jgi:AcrR family transcriptional regulator